MHPFPPTQPDCTNSALFVTDVTIPDNTNIVGGTKFTKTWRISNNGTCVWGPTYTLSHYSDERLGAPDSVPLGLTYPGSTLDISVDLTAPNTTGTHRGNFVIKNPQGLIMKIADDSRLWVIINVTTVSAATVAVTPTPIRTSYDTRRICDAHADRSHFHAERLRFHHFGAVPSPPTGPN